MKTWISLFICYSLLLYGGTWIVLQPKQNVWKTLANITKQEILCLSVASPSNPFSTCLVRLPMDVWPIPVDTIRTLKTQGHRTKVVKPNPVDDWDHWIKRLPYTPNEPQELELLGSIKMDYCIKLWVMSNWRDVSSNNKLYRNETLWCNYTAYAWSKTYQI